MQWSMWDRIQGVRNNELSTLWRSFIIQALFGFTLNTIPVLVSVLTFGVYVLLGNKLTASEAFTSLSLFTVCLWPLFLVSTLAGADHGVELLHHSDLVCSHPTDHSCACLWAHFWRLRPAGQQADCL